MARLQGKVALISGAGTGIGRAAAELFAQEGAKIAIAELKPELGSGAEKAIREAGGEALFLETDVTDDASVEHAVRETVSRFGKLDVLYNCAGGSIPEDAPITDVPLWVWDHTMALDLKGPMLCCRFGIPELIKAGGGSVINMSSTAALSGVPMHIYSAAKGGVISLTRSLASQYSSQQVRVNAICPGVVLTDRVRARFGNLPGTEDGAEDSRAARTAARYPFGVGQAIDIAQIALFLASDESRMVNAAILAADGGLSAY